MSYEDTLKQVGEQISLRSAADTQLRQVVARINDTLDGTPYLLILGLAAQNVEYFSVSITLRRDGRDIAESAIQFGPVRQVAFQLAGFRATGAELPVSDAWMARLIETWVSDVQIQPHRY